MGKGGGRWEREWKLGNDTRQSVWVFGSVNKKIVSQRHVANAMPYICYKANNFPTAPLCTKIDLNNAHGVKCFFLMKTLTLKGKLQTFILIRVLMFTLHCLHYIQCLNMVKQC